MPINPSAFIVAVYYRVSAPSDWTKVYFSSRSEAETWVAIAKADDIRYWGVEGEYHIVVYERVG